MLTLHPAHFKKGLIHIYPRVTLKGRQYSMTKLHRTHKEAHDVLAASRGFVATSGLPPKMGLTFRNPPWVNCDRARSAGCIIG